MLRIFVIVEIDRELKAKNDPYVQTKYNYKRANFKNWICLGISAKHNRFLDLSQHNLKEDKTVKILYFLGWCILERIFLL